MAAEKRVPLVMESRPASARTSEKEAKAKDAALQSAVKQIEQQFGAGSLMRLGDDAAVDVDAIPTGGTTLDLALGVGGVPRGRIVEIFGPESSGKTTLVYHIIAEAQARGGVCAFVDAEHAIDPIYARRIGVDTDELLVSQPDYGEQALEIVDVLVRSGAVDVVAVDSVAALTPRVELEGQMGETHGRPPGAPDVAGAAQARREPEPGEDRLPVHEPDPREDRRHRSARPRPSRAAARSSSTPRSASTCAASRPSRRAPRRSATGCA